MSGKIHFKTYLLGMKWTFYNLTRVSPPGRSNSDTPNKGTPKYMEQNMAEMKREIDNSTTIVVVILNF